MRSGSVSRHCRERWHSDEVVRLDRPYVDDTKAVAELAGRSGLQPVLVGNCFGARTALAYAARHHGVAGLVLLVPLSTISRWPGGLTVVRFRTSPTGSHLPICGGCCAAAHTGRRSAAPARPSSTSPAVGSAAGRTRARSGSVAGSCASSSRWWPTGTGAVRLRRRGQLRARLRNSEQHPATSAVGVGGTQVRVVPVPVEYTDSPVCRPRRLP